MAAQLRQMRQQLALDDGVFKPSCAQRIAAT